MAKKTFPRNLTPSAIARYALNDCLMFTQLWFYERFERKFEIGEHHRLIASKLDEVLAGKCPRLIINIAPRYGKTELAVKTFIAMGLAINPRAKFLHLSYSQGLALDNSREVQEIIRLPAYQTAYPDVKLSTTNVQRWRTTMNGGLYAVSSAGQVTGFGAGLVDESSEKESDENIANEVTEIDRNNADKPTFGGAIIIDDPIKPDDALSDVIREKINQKFDSTIRNRVNSRNTPIIIIMQRLHENDLCGYLMKNEPDQWQVLSLPCIRINEKGDREALWPFKQSLEELDKLKETNPFVFETQYMQDPKPLEGLMYDRPFDTYTFLPRERKGHMKAYIDTADTGSDYLCAIVYYECDIANYICDVLFTQKPMEYTEPATARLLTHWGVEEAIIESNNGGRSFARAVESQLRLLGNNATYIRKFTQTQNKAGRIFDRSNEVMNLCKMPEKWDAKMPEFFHQISYYMKVGRNAHDDAPDALTGTVEFRDNRKVRLATLIG